MSHGAIIWSELNTRDPAGAMAFYTATLGWTFHDVPLAGHTYWLARMDDAPVMAGIFDLRRPEFDGIGDHWLTYVGVDDVDRRVAEALALGATLIRPIFDVPGTGRIAIIRAPGGAVVGWMTSKEG
jgi:predicted enzyme related to lactoylglutathione lyase